MPDKIDDEDKLHALITILFEGWAQALHKMDSLELAGQSVPNFRTKYQEAFDNPLRQQHTQERIERLRELCEQIANTEIDVEELCSLLRSHLAAMQKPPN